MNIRKQIIAKIKSDKVSIIQLAEAAGMHRTTIDRYIKGEFDLNTERASRILTVLGGKLTFE